jgi:hypothetical protein
MALHINHRRRPSTNNNSTSSSRRILRLTAHLRRPSIM